MSSLSEICGLQTKVSEMPNSKGKKSLLKKINEIVSYLTRHKDINNIGILYVAEIKMDMEKLND